MVRATFRGKASKMDCFSLSLAKARDTRAFLTATLFTEALAKLNGDFVFVAFGVETAFFTALAVGLATFFEGFLEVLRTFSAFLPLATVVD